MDITLLLISIVIGAVVLLFLVGLFKKA